jgi:capsid protein
MLDPVKEAKGVAELLKSGLVSWSESARKQGYDPQDVMEEMADDLKAFDAVGVVPAWDGRLLKIKAQGAGSAPTSE